jgi:hypothetical protein
VAITQNYVSARNLPAVLAHLRDRPHCVSGVDPARRPALFAEFAAALAERGHSVAPAPAAPARSTRPERAAGAVQRRAPARAAPAARTSLWAQLVPRGGGEGGTAGEGGGGEGAGATGFAFGF